jgi:hypothetical protein
MNKSLQKKKVPALAPETARRIAAINDTLLAKCEDVLRAIATPEPAPPLPGVWRYAANIMALWQMCGHEACARAKACKRQSGQCVAACAGEIPHAVRAGACRLMRSRCTGLPYAAVRRRARHEVAAVEAWLADAQR